MMTVKFYTSQLKPFINLILLQVQLQLHSDTELHFVYDSDCIYCAKLLTR